MFASELAFPLTLTGKLCALLPPAPFFLLPLIQRNKRAVFRPYVISGRTDNFVVLTLFDNVRRPAGDAGDNKQWSEHLVASRFFLG